MPERGTTPFFMDDLCHTLPFTFRSVLSTAVIEWSTNPSIAANRYPIVDILSFTSVEIVVFNLLSNVRLLHGMDTKPQAIASLWLYRQQSIIRKVCKALFESILNLSYNKASQNYRWRIYIWSAVLLCCCRHTRPRYTTYQIQNVRV